MELRSNKKRKSETIPTVIKGKPDGKKAVPAARISVHYIGKLLENDKIFVDFTKTPHEFILGGPPIARSGVEGMLVGDKRKITIPPHMGYWKHSDGKLVPPDAWLVFEVELLDVRAEENSMIETTSDVTKHEHGLTIDVLVKGKPDGKIAVPGKWIRARYTGKLQKNGEIFDSIKRLKKFFLGDNKCGLGFDFGINGMRVGEKRKITVPLVYGDRLHGDGKLVLPHAWLAFEVELVDVIDEENC